VTAISWRIISSLYGGHVGKALFLVGLVVPMAKLNSWGINFENYVYYLTGSITILIGFVLVKIYAPGVIIEFQTPQSYATSVLERSKADAFDYRIEFNGLDTYSNKKELLKLANFPNTYSDHFPVEEALKVLGKDIFAYYFGLLNYTIMDNSSPTARFFCAMLFVCGVCAIYIPVTQGILLFYSEVVA
jgi:hypothetical protein